MKPCTLSTLCPHELTSFEPGGQCIVAHILWINVTASITHFWAYDMINIVTGCHIVKDMSLGGMSMIFNSVLQP